VPPYPEPSTLISETFAKRTCAQPVLARLLPVRRTNRVLSVS